MPEGIVGADRRHRQPRLHSAQELRQLVRRTVVRNFENVGLQRDAEIQQHLLRLLLDVTGEQHGSPAGGGES
jgi:hypothetical protein